MVSVSIAGLLGVFQVYGLLLMGIAGKVWQAVCPKLARLNYVRLNLWIYFCYLWEHATYLRLLAWYFGRHGYLFG
jgi:hypothetical protein